jgi:hypothetical protein
MRTTVLAAFVLAFSTTGVVAQQGTTEQQQTQRQTQATQRDTAQQAGAQKNALTMLASPKSQAHMQAMKSGCWVHLYTEQDFSGQPLMIAGPVEISNLKQAAGSGVAGFGGFSSIEVGKKAKVTLYDNENFEDPTAKVKSGQRIANLDDKKLGLFESIESMRVQC